MMVHLVQEVILKSTQVQTEYKYEYIFSTQIVLSKYIIWAHFVQVLIVFNGPFGS